MNKAFLLLIVSISAFANTVLDGNSDTTTLAGRAEYARYLYYTVNGAGAGYSVQNQAYLDQINMVTGSTGLGGILFEGGYKTCDDIPASGSLTGTVMNQSITLVFGTPTKTVPASYGANGGLAMNKRINVSSGDFINLQLELKCDTDTNIQTGYLLMDYPNAAFKNESYFYTNATTGAANVDVYIEAETGSGQKLIMPTHFKTTDGTNFNLYSGYVGTNGTNFVVAIKGEANGKAQLAFLSSYATSGAVMTTTPDNYGDLTSGMDTTIEIDCVDMSTNTATTGCSTIDAPDTISMNGRSNSWTITDLKNISLSSI